MEKLRHIFRKIVQIIYSLPIKQAVWIVLLIPVAWAVLFAFLLDGKWKKKALAVLASLAALGIIVETLLLRTDETREINLLLLARIFGSLKHQEGFRTFLMNVLLFEPLGLTLVFALSEQWSRGKRIALTVLLGFGLSFCVEVLQYVFARGNSELDDLLANTIGTALGAASLFLTDLFQKRFHKLRDKLKETK